MVLRVVYFVWSQRRTAAAGLDKLQRAERTADGERLPARCCDRLAALCKCAACGDTLRRRLRPLFTGGTVANDIGRLLAVIAMAQAMGALSWLVLCMRLPASHPAVGLAIGMCTLAIAAAMLVSADLLQLVTVAFPLMVTRHAAAMLLMLVIVLALQGPATNLDENQLALLRAMDCVREKVHKEGDNMQGYAANALRDRFAYIDNINERLEQMAHTFRKDMRLIHERLVRLAAIIGDEFEWLEKIRHISCDALLLTPYWGCRRVFQEMEANCYGGIWDVFCDLFGMFSAVCELSRSLRKTCQLPGYIGDKLKMHVFDRIKNAVVKVAKDIERALAFELRMTQTLDTDIDVRSNMTAYAQSLVDKWRQATSVCRATKDLTVTILDWSLLPALFLLPVLFAAIYRHRYLKSCTLDNYFMTGEFARIERRRALCDMDTLLPLAPGQRDKCISPWRPWPAGIECAMLRRHWLFITVSLLLVAVYCVGDIVLYVVYNELHFYFSNQSIAEDVPPFYTVDISGNGTLADIMRDILHSLVALREPQASIDQWKVCFDDAPSRPDYDLITLLCIMSLLCYASAVLSIYACRTRPFILDAYYPRRARIRAMTLYSKLLRKRKGLFDLTLAKIKEKAPVVRDKLKAYGRGVKAEAKLGRVAAKLLPFTAVGRQYCCVCAVAGALSDTDNFARCANDTCAAVYCVKCYNRRQCCRFCGLPLTSRRTNIIAELDSSPTSESELDDVTI